MKKLLIPLLLTIFILAGCSANPAKSAEYKPVEICAEISLPIDTVNILDTAQIGECLYILGDGGVYSLNLETNESTRLFDSDCLHINAYDGMLHLFLPEKGSFRTYTTEGELKNEIYLDDFKKPELNNFKGFAVGEDCYIFASQDESGRMVYVTADRETGEIKTFNAPKNIRRICSYKDNSFLIVCFDIAMTECNVWELNADTQKAVKLTELNDVYLFFDFEYNPDADSLLFTACDFDLQVYISEFSLANRENSIIAKPKILISGPTKCCLSVSQNIVSLVSDCSRDYMYYDYENPPEYITFAYFGLEEYITRFIKQYESRSGVLVRIVHYEGEQVDNLNIKLMAGDSDIDCFYTSSLRKFAYITNHEFTDLYQFEGLKERIGSNPFIEQISTYKDSCFGIPFKVKYYPVGSTPYDSVSADMVEYLEEQRINGGFMYLRGEQLKSYIRKNINLENKTYADPSGEEFYQVLRKAYDNMEVCDKLPDYRDIPYIYAEIPYVESEYVIMNPSSCKKELAADFLIAFYDYINDGISDEAFEASFGRKSYPESKEKVDGLLIQWKYDDYTTNEALYNAYNSLPEADGSDKALRKLAQEAAAEVAMRIGE